MKKRNLMAAGIVLLLIGTQAQAASTDGDSVQPEFVTAADALQAANASATAATHNNAVKAALADVEKAQQHLETAVAKGDHTAVTSAQKQLQHAEAASARALHKVSGVSERDLLSMHDSGMGWQEIGHEIGIHPGLLGADTEGGLAGPTHSASGAMHQGISDRELHDATARNVESGWSKEDHGMGIADSSGGMSVSSSQRHDSIAGAGGLQHSSAAHNSMSDSDRDHGRSGLSGGTGDHDGFGGAGDHDGSGGSGGSSGSAGSGGDTGGQGSGDPGGHGGGSDGAGGSGDSGGHGGGDSGGHGGGDSGGHR